MTDRVSHASDAHRLPGRLEWIDVARGGALLAMAIYHFAWDLEFFGYLAPATTAYGGWRLFARCIASSFLILVGVSLVLAHARGLRLRPYLMRLARVAGAAVAISLVTWLAVPGGFIFFGILHQIALASILGLAFLRVHWLGCAAVAAAVIAAPEFLRSAAFDHPAWWWVGLSSANPPSNDYVPLFPWFGAVLLGMAAAKLSARLGVFEWLSSRGPGAWSRPLAFGGRHSLAFYLVHQPVLLGLIGLVSLVSPAERATPEGRFLAACEQSCIAGRDAAFCASYCPCVLDGLEQQDMLDAVFSGVQDETVRARLDGVVAMCTASSDMSEEEAR